MTERGRLEAVRQAAVWFTPSQEGVAPPLMDLIGDARVVLVGAATHGSREFYRIRAELTRALIRTKQFNCLAVEADWQDAYRVNRWVRHASNDPAPAAALDDFVCFPRWMWRNTAVAEFVEWLRGYNAKRMAVDRVGFVGLDLHSLHASADAVLKYLAGVDPEAAAKARRHYGCFEEFGTDSTHSGADAAALGLSDALKDDVVGHLMGLRQAKARYAGPNAAVARDEHFYAEQESRAMREAERYYRTMFAGHPEAWNTRDTHMSDTLDSLLTWTTQRAGYARAVVWAHNSHLGDARATQMGESGGVNLGQLVRERHGDKAFLVGFTTHAGTVTAAREWGDAPERRSLAPSLRGSYERLFHDTGVGEFVLSMAPLREALSDSRPERTIGAIYKSDTERSSHYYLARLADQFDAVIHVDTTTAVAPLTRSSRDDASVPETYPSGV